MSIMKLIGIEEHFFTSEVHDARNAIALETIDPSVAFHAGAIDEAASRTGRA